jgi:hypothetical protein
MRVLAISFLAFLSYQASAAIEKVGAPTESGLHLMWWPKVAPPKGWHFDQGSSYHFSFNAIAPDGSTFSKAETVMYARADYKPRITGVKSLSEYISNDIEGFKQNDESLVVSHEQPILGKDGLEFRVISYSPGQDHAGNWERVAYGEDGDYYLTFAISSRTKEGLAAAIPAFNSFVLGYRSGP